MVKLIAPLAFRLIRNYLRKFTDKLSEGKPLAALSAVFLEEVADRLEMILDIFIDADKDNKTQMKTFWKVQIPSFTGNVLSFVKNNSIPEVGLPMPVETLVVGRVTAVQALVELLHDEDPNNKAQVAKWAREEGDKAVDDSIDILINTLETTERFKDRNDIAVVIEILETIKKEKLFQK